MLLSLILIGLLASASSIAYAAEPKYPDYVYACSEYGLEKLHQKAAEWERMIDENSFHVCGVDYRWYNPSRYVWYCADSTNSSGDLNTMSVLVQRIFGRCY